jgi:hypothetical protein
MNGLNRTIERKAGLSNAAPQRHTGLRAVAESLSLANVDQAICELMNEALCRVAQLAYETDAGGLCNLDAASGKILFALPFGRNGHKQWGLRPSEANILREILFTWQAAGSTLLQYDRTRRSWFVNLRDHANIHLAKKWLKAHQIDIATYRAARAKRVDGA